LPPRFPEPKTVKNRLHLDLNLTDGPQSPLDQRKEKLAGELERLTKLGASPVEEHEQRNEYWVVMRDPEGNEFCIH
jgi:hypothetical protein